MQDIAGPQRPAAVTAELAQGEGALAAQVIRQLQAAAQGEVASDARALDSAKRERRASGHEQGRVHGLLGAIEQDRQPRAGDRHHRGRAKTQSRSRHRDLEPGRAFGVTQQPVAQAQRAVVHGAGRRHAHRPVALAAWPVLHRGQRARGQHVERRAAVGQRFQAPRPGRSAGKGRIRQDLAQIVAIGLHAVETGLRQGRVQRVARRVAGGRAGDHLGDHGVEVRRDFAAGFHPGVDPQRATVGGGEGHLAQQARTGLEIASGVFGVQPRLDGVSLGPQPLRELLQRGQRAGGEFDHPAHEVHAPDLLGDAVLDLQPGVDLQEIEALRIAVIDELHRAGAAIAHRARQRHGRLAERAGDGIGQVGRRGFLYDLLVASLHRAVAHAQGQHAAPAVAEYLHFQMAGAFDVALDEDARIAEVALPQALHDSEGVLQLLR